MSHVAEAACPPLALIHHPGYRIALPEKHPFPMDKFSVLKRLLDRQLVDCARAVEWVMPSPPRRKTCSACTPAATCMNFSVAP
ncbi:hypothetical protein ACU8V3_10420 [Cobetia marina]